jgi:nitroreductase
MVQKLAEGDPGARPVFVVSYTRPGWSLWKASRDDRLADLIQDVSWNTVVLQEHGALATASLERRSRMTNPYVRDLQSRIEARGARTMIFMNWWQRQDSDLAAVLFLPVVPVGPAVAQAYRRRPDIQLFLRDGHPSRAGSFLAASVFYVYLTWRDPSKSTFTAGLTEQDATFLKSLAGEYLTGTK